MNAHKFFKGAQYNQLYKIEFSFWFYFGLKFLIFSHIAFKILAFNHFLKDCWMLFSTSFNSDFLDCINEIPPVLIILNCVNIFPSFMESISSWGSIPVLIQYCLRLLITLLPIQHISSRVFIIVAACRNHLH